MVSISFIQDIVKKMDDLDFTEEEIKEQLENLGYTNVSDARLKEFKRGK